MRTLAECGTERLVLFLPGTAPEKEYVPHVMYVANAPYDEYGREINVVHNDFTPSQLARVPDASAVPKVETDASVSVSTDVLGVDALRELTKFSIQ